MIKLRKYLTDLTTKQWQLIQSHFAKPSNKGRKRTYSRRNRAVFKCYFAKGSGFLENLSAGEKVVLKGKLTNLNEMYSGRIGGDVNNCEIIK